MEINVKNTKDICVYYLEKEEKKEMLVKDIQAIINGKRYKVNSATVTNSPGEWTEVDFQVVLAPFNTISIPEIVNVIFNYPATIVFWSDGTKTVVKCDGEDFDPEKAIAMAYMKKSMGNKGNYYNTIRKWVENGEYYGFEKEEDDPSNIIKAFIESMKKVNGLDL